MGAAALQAHLAGGAATVCRCWALERRDGTVLGFTDHDLPLGFEGVEFRPEAGMTAKALVQGTGLAVDNTEAVGALSDAAISEADILAGRWDGAALRVWLVNWQDVAARQLLFRGTLGEVVRAGGAFRAELRGLAEALNRPQGRVYQGPCSAVLGDARCGVDLTDPAHAASVTVDGVEEARVLRFAGLGGYQAGWFAAGRVIVESGAAAGLSGTVKADRATGTFREIELWQALRVEVAPGDAVRLVAGCDRRAATCREKFGNFLNFRGFPHIPGEDWLTSYPRQAGVNDGGSRGAGVAGYPGMEDLA